MKNRAPAHASEKAAAFSGFTAVFPARAGRIALLFVRKPTPENRPVSHRGSVSFFRKTSKPQCRSGFADPVSLGNFSLRHRQAPFQKLQNLRRSGFSKRNVPPRSFSAHSALFAKTISHHARPLRRGQRSFSKNLTRAAAVSQALRVLNAPAFSLQTRRIHAPLRRRGRPASPPGSSGCIPCSSPGGTRRSPASPADRPPRERSPCP